MPNAQPGQWIGYAISAVVILLVIALRMRNVGRLRPLKLERLWVVPALILLVAVSMFVQHPPATALGWALALLALAIGAALGWQRGRLMHIEVNAQTHEINQRASPAALLFIVALIVIRMGARSALMSGAGGALHMNAMALTDILIALALGLLTATRLEMYLRARRLLAEVKAAA